MRVLVVEDEPDVLNAVAAFLREEGFYVDTAANGEDGLFKAITWEYDAILLDVMLPDMDGYQVLHTLRTDASTAHIPVIFISGMDRPEDLARGLRASQKGA